MTVIAWDGKILAADKQATYGIFRKVGTKIYRLSSTEIIAVCGCSGTSQRMIEWYKNGAKTEDWPEELQNSDDWSNIIVANKDSVFWYDRQPYPLYLQQPFMAWGVGADFAMGALEMGADSIRAVEIASKHCEGCGFGVDWFEVCK
jgi:ATP-dependent protease HslVU (ClpYQ) peptidase subunit